MERLINEYNYFCGAHAKMEYDESGKCFFLCGRLDEWVVTEHGNGFKFKSIYSDNAVIYAKRGEQPGQLLIILHNTQYI